MRNTRNPLRARIVAGAVRRARNGTGLATRRDCGELDMDEPSVGMEGVARRWVEKSRPACNTEVSASNPWPLSLLAPSPDCEVVAALLSQISPSRSAPAGAYVPKAFFK